MLANQPSIGGLFFFAILGFLGAIFCALRSGYHLYKERRLASAVWFSAGWIWGCLVVFVIFNVLDR